MKKTLFTLGAFALVALGFAACGNSDCTCTPELEGEKMTNSVKVEDFDGDCDEVTFKDLGASWVEQAAKWSEMKMEFALVCEED
jgi:hypothetical protein